MAVPKGKVTAHRRGNRRSHDAISAVSSQTCPNCGALKQPHHVCMECGTYGDLQVVETASA